MPPQVYAYSYVPPVMSACNLAVNEVERTLVSHRDTKGDAEDLA
jgi:hypothetical protein